MVALLAREHYEGRMRLALLVLQHLQRAQRCVRRRHLLHELRTGHYLLHSIRLIYWLTVTRVIVSVKSQRGERTYPFLHGLLDALLLLVLAGSLAVELVAEVAESLFGAERAAVVVHVLQFDVGPEVRLLPEVLQGPRVAAAFAPPVLVVLAGMKRPREHSYLYIYASGLIWWKN